MDIFKLLSPSQLVNKILENEALADALLKALSVSLEAKKQVESQYEQTLSSLSLAPLTRLQAAEEELKVLEEELEALREQLTRLSTEAREGRRASEQLEVAHAEIEQLKARLNEVERSAETAPSTGATKVSWSKKMTKGQLLSLARENGLELKGTLKKDEMIVQLTASIGAPHDA
jgi:predicted nuclease with TOPRIM domain